MNKNTLVCDLQTAIGVPVQAGWIYGSTDSAFSRVNSDIDACFVSNSIPKSFEVHGASLVSGALKLIELRVYSELELNEKIESGQLQTILELAKSTQLGLDDALEAKMMTSAIKKMDKIWATTLSQHKQMSVSKIIAMMQLMMTEGDDVLSDMRLKNNRLAWSSRFQHFIVLFLSKAIILDGIVNPADISPTIKRTYLYLTHLNSVRCLDYEKFEYAPIFKILLQRIASIYPLEGDHKKVFSTLDSHFNELTGHSLLSRATVEQRIVV